MQAAAFPEARPRPVLAPTAHSRHWLRSVRRHAVLFASDLATFWLVREIYRLIANHAVLGQTVAAAMSGLLPTGYLKGLQFAVALPLGLLVTGNYRSGERRRDAGHLFTGCALAVALVLWSSIWTLPPQVVLGQFLVTTAGISLGLVASRLWLDAVLKRLAWSRRAERVLFVGTPRDCEATRNSPAFLDPAEFEEVGSVRLTDLTGPIAGQPDPIHATVRRLQVDTMVVCGALTDAGLQASVDAARAGGCRLLVSSHGWNVAGIDPQFVWQHGEPLLALSAPSVRASQLLVKRLADLIGAGIGLVLLSPLFAIVAALIRLDTPGPVFFRSERWGRDERRIRIWKFRTMVESAHAQLDSDPGLRTAFEHNLKLEGDPRITRVGQVLRRYSIDELPQLINVLLGQMSLVGPRPKLIGEESRYGEFFGVVVSVPPGMTGLWQVSGRSSLSYQARIALDVDYVRRCSLGLDLKILVQTLPVVVQGHGAH